MPVSNRATITRATAYQIEELGFEFGEIGFGGTHVHFHVNVPKRYSAQNAEIMLKSRAAMRIFKAHPGFRKRYPRGSFWSGYEHHMSIGLERKSREDYVKNQEKHHNVKVVDDRQKNLLGFTLLQERTWRAFVPKPQINRISNYVNLTF